MNRQLDLVPANDTSVNNYQAGANRFPGRGKPCHYAGSSSTGMGYSVVVLSPPGTGTLSGGQVSLAGARLLLAILFVFMLIFFIFASPFAYAASNGRISGQLLDGTKHNAPVSGQSVTLQMAQGNNARDVVSVKTDAHGSFAFGNLATDNTINYAIYTRYQGAQYNTGLIDLSTKPVQQANLTVYDATSSTAKIAIVQATVLLHDPSAQVGVLSVSEVFFFKNVGTYAYVGSLDASKGMPDALRFALPPGARNISLSKGFDGYNVIQVDRGFATDAALPPGNSQFIFSFELPYTGSGYNFSYAVVYPTVQFSLLVPTEVNVNSNALTSNGVITADQHPYHLYQAKDLLAGATLAAQFQGLPAPQASTASSSNTQGNGLPAWLPVLLLLMLAILAMTWLLYRSVRRPARARHQQRLHNGKQGGKKATEAIVSSRDDLVLDESTSLDTLGSYYSSRSGDGGARVEAGALADRRQALLLELLDLDRAYEAGKLKKTVYQQRRAKTKARLRTIMSQEEINHTSR